VDGQSLRAFLDEGHGPQSARFVQKFLTTIGGAVAHAHRKGVYDLNIKPPNIIITEQETPSDRSFMMSLNSYREEPFLDDERWRAEKKDVFYVPLEYRGGSEEESDLRLADQYRLGLVAYEMLVGAARFEELAKGLRERVINPATWVWPALEEKNCKCPEQLRTAVNRMVNVDPNDRYDTLADALQDVATNLYTEIARESYRRILETQEKQTEFFRSFYISFLDQFPKAETRFFEKFGALEPTGEVPETWNRQFQLLKEAVLLLVVFSALHEDRHEPNILTRIAEEHAKRGMPSFLYPDFAIVLIDCLVRLDQPPDSIDKHQLRRAWSNVVRPGIEYLETKTKTFEAAMWRQKD
jgi:serine/threonine protein kinase